LFKTFEGFSLIEPITLPAAVLDSTYAMINTKDKELQLAGTEALTSFANSKKRKGSLIFNHPICIPSNVADSIFSMMHENGELYISAITTLCALLNQGRFFSL
jgi:hypothetical protein